MSPRIEDYITIDEEGYDKEEEDHYDYLLEWFEKNPGVYYYRQLEVLHEDRKFHWITRRVLDRLVEDGVLRRLVRTRTRGLVVSFVYTTQLTKTYVNQRISQLIKIINEYSESNLQHDVGDWAEFLVKNMFEKYGWRVVARHANEFRGVQWPKSKENIDFIFKKNDIVIGVEVKDTLGYIKSTELRSKTEMCVYLGVLPCFVLRKAPRMYQNLVNYYEGFISYFLTKFYPYHYSDFVHRIYEQTMLPVNAWWEIPEKVQGIIKRWFDTLK